MKLLPALSSIVCTLLLLPTVLGVSAMPTLEQAALPSPDYTQEPDRCEPNDQVDQACVLAMDAIAGPFTLVPEGDVDRYSLDLGSTPGQAVTLTIRATAGLDLYVTLYQAGASQALVTMTSPDLTTILPATLTGWVVFRIEHRGANLVAGESYRIEVRSSSVATPLPGGIPLQATPDALENNWSPETAAPVAVGVVYALTLACPDLTPGACPGGDHDYMQIPVKQGEAYLIAAYDPAPGVDPVIDLFWPDGMTLVAANDDAAQGSFASLVVWHAPADGMLIARVGPRNGGTIPVVPPDRQHAPGSYQFAVVLAGSEQAQAILATVRQAAPERVAGQASKGVSDAAPLQTATPVISTDAIKGRAVVTAEQGAPLFVAPDQIAQRITTLAPGSLVDLLGVVSGVWVRVQPIDGVVPGWVRAETLVQFDPDPTSTPQPGDLTSTVHTPSVPPMLPTVAPTQRANPTPQVERLPSRASAALPTTIARISLELTVHIGWTDRTLPVASRRSALRTGSTPTTMPNQPLRGMRVQIVNVFGDVLTEATTPASGSVTLRRDHVPQLAARVRLPAIGVELPIESDQAEVTIVLPAPAK